MSLVHCVDTLRGLLAAPAPPDGAVIEAALQRLAEAAATTAAAGVAPEAERAVLAVRQAYEAYRTTSVFAGCVCALLALAAHAHAHPLVASYFIASSLQQITSGGQSMRPSSRGSTVLRGGWCRLLLALAAGARGASTWAAPSPTLLTAALALLPTTPSHAARVHVVAAAACAVACGALRVPAAGAPPPAPARPAVAAAVWAAVQELADCIPSLAAACTPGGGVDCAALLALGERVVASPSLAGSVAAGFEGVQLPLASVTVSGSRELVLRGRLSLHVSVHGLELCLHRPEPGASSSSSSSSSGDGGGGGASGSRISGTRMSPLAGWPELAAVHFVVGGARHSHKPNEISQSDASSPAWRVRLLLLTDDSLVAATPALAPMLSGSRGWGGSSVHPDPAADGARLEEEEQAQQRAPPPAAAAGASEAPPMRPLSLDLAFADLPSFVAARHALIAMRPRYVGRGAVEATQAELSATGGSAAAGAPGAVPQLAARAGPALFDCRGHRDSAAACEAHMRAYAAAAGLCAAALASASAPPPASHANGACDPTPVTEAPSTAHAAAYLRLSTPAVDAATGVAVRRARSVLVPRHAAAAAAAAAEAADGAGAHDAECDADDAGGSVCTDLTQLVGDEAEGAAEAEGSEGELGGRAMGGDEGGGAPTAASAAPPASAKGDAHAPAAAAAAAAAVPTAAGGASRSAIAGLQGRLQGELLMLSEYSDTAEAATALALAGGGTAASNAAFFAALERAPAAKCSATPSIAIRSAAPAAAAIEPRGVPPGMGGMIDVDTGGGADDEGDEAMGGGSFGPPAAAPPPSAAPAAAPPDTATAAAPLAAPPPPLGPLPSGISSHAPLPSGGGAHGSSSPLVSTTGGASSAPPAAAAQLGGQLAAEATVPPAVLAPPSSARPSLPPAVGSKSSRSASASGSLAVRSPRGDDGGSPADADSPHKRRRTSPLERVDADGDEAPEERLGHAAGLATATPAARSGSLTLAGAAQSTRTVLGPLAGPAALLTAAGGGGGGSSHVAQAARRLMTSSPPAPLVGAHLLPEGGGGERSGEPPQPPPSQEAPSLLNDPIVRAQLGAVRFDALPGASADDGAAPALAARINAACARLSTALSASHLLAFPPAEAQAALTGSHALLIDERNNLVQRLEARASVVSDRVLTEVELHERAFERAASSAGAAITAVAEAACEAAQRGVSSAQSRARSLLDATDRVQRAQRAVQQLLSQQSRDAWRTQASDAVAAAGARLVQNGSSLLALARGVTTRDSLPKV